MKAPRCPRWLPIVAVAALVAWGCDRGSEEEQQGPIPGRVDEHGRIALTQEERATIGLETVSVEQGVLTTSTLRFGRVVARPQEDTLVTAPVTGRLTAPPLALGAPVVTGEVLVTLEPLVDAASRASLEAQRRELAGQIEGARAQVEAAQADLRRVGTLVESGLATEADKAQARADLASEQARVESLGRASDELGRMTGGHIELRAPVGGVLVALATEVGSVIPQGAVVARIVKAGPRWVDVAVPPGDPIGSGYLVRGVAGAVSANLLTRGAVIQAEGTRRDRLEAPPEAAATLPPGATVPVEVLHDTPGMLVPAIALVRRGLTTLVFVEVEEGRYEPRPVQVVARDDTRAAVGSGLAIGDHIVTQGASSLLGELGAEASGDGRGSRE